MKPNPKCVAQMLETLKDLGILEKKNDKFLVAKDFDFVIRGLMIKQLKRLCGEPTKRQWQQIEAEVLVNALYTYGFLTISQKPTEIEFAVNCLLTFRNEKLEKIVDVPFEEEG